MKITIRGTDKVISNLSKKKKVTQKNMQKGLKKAAFFLQGEIKASIAGHRNEPTSVDTGRFLNSVDINVGKKDAIIFSNIPYSKYLEYGTSRIKPRKHFNNSKSRKKQKITDIMKKNI